MSRLIISALLLVMPLLGQAAGGGGIHLDDPRIDLGDKASLRNGAKVFVNYCLNCHSAHYMRYNRMARDLGMSDEEIKSLMYSADKLGDTMTVATRPEEAKDWFGTAPPDLSVIARARGAAWIYTYLRAFYADEARPFGVNNRVFPDVAMPHVLQELQGLQAPVLKTVTDADGQPKQVIDKLQLNGSGRMSAKEYDNLVRDLVGFLVYLGEPAKLERYVIGTWVLLFLAVFTVLLYLLKREYWRELH